MNGALSANTQAILLLTAPLLVGQGEAAVELLSLGEYNKLARLLREKQKQPADLIGPAANEVLSLCVPMFERARLEALLGRGFLLSQAVDHWQARAIWVVSRADPTYPRRLKARLKEDAPPVLYGCGAARLLERGGLAVVGSRHVDAELIAYTQNLGALAAAAHRPLVSGAARGIDQAAMAGALEAGGIVVGVMADSLERAVLARGNREPLMEERLVLVSPFDPAAGFNVGNAMQRNKLIYALAEAALVVAADLEKGGTWAGAVEQLNRFHFVPVFVRNGSTAGKGNAALLKKGARAWPEPADADALDQTIRTGIAALQSEPQQETLGLTVRETATDPTVSYPRGDALPLPLGQSAAAQTGPKAADELWAAVRAILLQQLQQSRTQTELAETLGVTAAQTKAWLARLLEEGVVEKKANPTRYRVLTGAGRSL